MIERTHHQRVTTVLLVEFDQVDADRIMTALASSDTYPFSIKWVTRLDAALEAVESQAYDIILLDIMIPTITGLDILDQLRAPNAKPLKAKIIIATNLEQGEEGRAAVEQKADGYIIKAEITPRQLVEFFDQLNLGSQ